MQLILDSLADGLKTGGLGFLVVLIHQSLCGGRVLSQAQHDLGLVLSLDSGNCGVSGLQFGGGGVIEGEACDSAGDVGVGVIAILGDGLGVIGKVSVSADEVGVRYTVMFSNTISFVSWISYRCFIQCFLRLLVITNEVITVWIGTVRITPIVPHRPLKISMMMAL